MRSLCRFRVAARVLAAGLLASALGVSPASAVDWPNWRNDAGNTGQTADPISLPLVERWHSTAPLVEENGAVVANGIAYMSTDDGKLFAFDVTTGFAVPGFPVNTAANFGTPAVDTANGQIYVLAGTTLFAFRLDGSPAWTRAVGAVGANYNEGPVVEGGYVYLKAAGFVQKWSAAGVQAWTQATGGGNNTQPAVMGDFVYVNTESGLIRKYDKATGVQQVGGGFPIVTPGSQAALATVNGKIFHKANLLYAYSSTTGALLWSRAAGGDSTYYGTPAVAGGVVYVYGWDGLMYAFDENTGAPMAGFPSVQLNPGSDRNWGSPTVASGKVFIGAGQSQKLKVLGAAGTANAGQVLEEHLTFSTDPQGFDLCSTVIAGGWVFAMLDGGGLYAFYAGGGPPPQGALVINGGETCTTSREVVLTIGNSNNPNVNQMRISEDPFFTGVPWVAYAPTANFTLSAGFGTKTVYAQLRDTAGQLSNVFTDQIDFKDTCFVQRTCDVDADGDVDRNDISLIFIARNTAASSANDPRDWNHDGFITVQDSRGCSLSCTKANCAP